MKKSAVLTLALVVAVVMPGCKLMRTSDYQRAMSKSEDGGADKIASLIDQSFDAKLVPLLKSQAVEAATLIEGIKSGLDENGAKLHGLHIGGSGGSWNFAIKGTAKVLEMNRQSKAGIARLDIDGDGKADATLQIGPVVKGTALRDLAPFYDFSQFRDQIQFARLARGINDHALNGIPSLESDLTGKTVTFLGAVAVRSASEPLLIMPVQVDVAP